MTDKKYELVKNENGIYEPGTPKPVGFIWTADGFYLTGPHRNIILDASDIMRTGKVRINTDAPYRDMFKFELIGWRDGLMTYKIVEEDEPTFGRYSPFKGQNSHDGPSWKDKRE